MPLDERGSGMLRLQDLMTTNAFLAALPAILAVAAFVIYRLIGHQSQGNQVTRDILAKLRRDSPESVAAIEHLTPRQVAAKLRFDHRVREKVTDHDILLLTRVSSHEFVKALVVYGLIGSCF